MRQLPIYKGYTVDFRLKELRKIIYGEVPEYIPFTSKKGQKTIKRVFKDTGRRKREIV